MQGFGSQALIDRMKGAARLDPATYESVERDTGATMQALAVVAIASLARGIGGIREDGAEGFLGGVIDGLVGWLVFAAFVYFVGTRLLNTVETEADLGQVLRTTGFAHTPMILGVFYLIPILGGIVGFAAYVWFLIASVIAVRHALEMSIGRAIGTILVAGVIRFALALIIGIILGIALWGPGA
jgi:hypothetical protein